MIFSRKATHDDFLIEDEKWAKLLHPEVRSEFSYGSKSKAVFIYNQYNGCGIQRAKETIDQYEKFIAAWDDLNDNKEVFIQY
ncbi:hypothetical protein F4V43_02090 [Paenibacillus spiritus]|uniref:Uncharacterized protein n=1 Tax=Paenibacillus spiritus TaxID=2496557 RepID=A0A5J5GGF8_9BACL|nr:hypothetical protein [Paenibacillus spiritus]KAA9007299.1 hypothetical protein F4V43_02090 [Paenibacillus spiritus]